MLSVKQFQNEYVGQIDYYITLSFPKSQQSERDILLAATMVAAKMTAVHDEAHLIEYAAMMRSRATRSVKKLFDDDDGPVYQTKPRKKRAALP